MSKKKNQIAEELLQIENKKFSLIEQSLNSSENCTNERDKLHMSFFVPLLPSSRQISDHDILVCRNDISHIVFKYAYKGAAWKSLNQDKVESARGIKRKIDEDDDCQIMSYIPPPAQLNHIMKIKEEKEEKYRPSLTERYLERRNCSESTIMPWIGRHTRDHVSSTPLNWNNRDCHTQSVTAGPCSSETITHPSSNLHCRPSLTGGNYHKAITPRPSATVTHPPRDLHSGTPLTGDDHGQSIYQQTENVDYLNHRTISPRYSPVTVTHPTTNERSGTLTGANLGQGKKSACNWF
ncbi:uncharacterized protein LOC116417275 isoform X1 [Nasonia vitripennis]|uniref:Uncharacterized protein n=2 Tax=Nasonia vitripennis TaxID=7425 RepID=A0A7M7QHF0_NASVI|nr:uncharacterized protein LOC116417275 isoform X1 [Nasonia vitripennis]